jgi:hypothetical protein
MHTDFHSTAFCHSLCATLVVAVLGLLTGCDSGGPEPSMEPAFDMSIGSPVETSIKGKAALGSNLSFEEQGVFTFPVPPLGKTVSIVQLSGEAEQGIAHDVSFLRLADEGLSEGTYALNRPCEDGCIGAFPPDELLTADYSRQTADSLYSYPIRSGSLTVETANDEGVAGRFSLSSSLEVSVARADLEAFIDSLRRVPRDTAFVPPRPPTNLQFLEEPLTIEGTFTATAGEPLSDRVPHLGGFGWDTRRDTLRFDP